MNNPIKPGSPLSRALDTRSMHCAWFAGGSQLARQQCLGTGLYQCSVFKFFR